MKQLSIWFSFTNLAVLSEPVIGTREDPSH